MDAKTIEYVLRQIVSMYTQYEGGADNDMVYFGASLALKNLYYNIAQNSSEYAKVSIEEFDKITTNKLYYGKDC